MNYAYVFGDFLTENVTNYGIVSEFTNTLRKQLSLKNCIILENSGESGSALPDYIIGGKIKFDVDIYYFSIVVSDYRDKMKQWSDQLYTRDIYTLNGTRDTAKAAAGRIIKLVKNETVLPYRENRNYQGNKLKYRELTNEIPVNSIIFNFIDVPMKYPYGYTYNFPLSFGVDLFQVGYCLFIPGTSLGIGVGTKVFDVHGPTAGSVLPLIVYLPLYITPASYGNYRNDIYLTAEWGFLIQQYSYLDLNVKVILNGINLSVGWLMLPAYSDSTITRDYYNTFYASITFSFGSYIVKWKER
jgi:hypothetical protein